MYICDNISLNSSQNENVSDKFAGKIKTRIWAFKNFFYENGVFYEIMWKNITDPDRPHITIKYGACALHTGYLRLKIHVQNM